MEKLSIEIRVEGDKGQVEVLCNGKAVPNLTKFKAEFDKNTGLFQFGGERLSLNEAGQYYVDDKGETAHEPINMLDYLNPFWRIRESVKRTLQEIEFSLMNIHDTSFHNTKLLFDEYGI